MKLEVGAPLHLLPSFPPPRPPDRQRILSTLRSLLMSSSSRYALARLCCSTVNQYKFTSNESEYYGPFNTLLTTVFPAADSYQIAPQFKSITGSMYFSVIYIMKRNVPVFFIEVKTYSAYERASFRKEADDQMRDRFLGFASGNIATPKLFGISALGSIVGSLSINIRTELGLSLRIVFFLTLTSSATLRPRRDGTMASWNWRERGGSWKLLLKSKRWRPNLTR